MRALTESEKGDRQRLLAGHAHFLFQEAGYQGVTMEAVAHRAGLAKGTVFLTFASKEDLFLHLVRLRFEAWFDRLDALVPADNSARTWAMELHRTIKEDPSLLPLLTLVAPVLEHGAGLEAVRTLKGAIAQRMVGLADRFSNFLPWVPRPAWFRLFLQTHALMVGVWTVGETSEVVRRALLERPELQFMVTRFDELFFPMMEAQLSALFAASS